MKYKRSSGILLHPTSLPGPFGIGDLGPRAYEWIDFLAKSGCSLWQVLPLGPTGYGDSPYQCFSAFAGNPYLISPEELLKDGLLNKEDLADLSPFLDERVDFGTVIPWKLALLEKAFECFQRVNSTKLRIELEEFHEQHKGWLDDFALFMAIKEDQGGGSWSAWPLPIKKHEANAIQEARQFLSEKVERQIFRQFIFYRQWKMLRAYAAQQEIKIIGDIPIFVAHDSADVWANIELFYMDEECNPTVVAGVPPDYFSPTGQLWGNPLYRWDVHAASGYAWWLNRFKAVLEFVDIVRLDHFRGFAGYWEVPAGNETAEIGKWVPGPGIPFLQAVQDSLGELPIIAEDLGVITPDVIELRDTFKLPGMKVLQFAWLTDPTDQFMPHNYSVNCVVYTGTHDNDTVRGWFSVIPEAERDFCRRYLGVSGRDLAWDMIRTAWATVGMMSLAPMQDLLDLGSKARMNFPGRPSGNWSWRMPEIALTDALCDRLHDMNYLYGRLKGGYPTQSIAQ
jgi:4-alpha-glucanotransferase